MIQPFVGLPTVASAGCAFAVDIDDPTCDQPSTMHVAVRSAAWGVVSLQTCDDHLPIARASGELLRDHAYRPGCETLDCWAGVA